MFNSQPTNTDGTKVTRGTRARVAGTLAATCLAGLLIPLAASAPVHASTKVIGCTMTPYQPKEHGVDPYDDLKRRELVRFRIGLICDRDRWVKVNLRAMENDDSVIGNRDDDKFADNDWKPFFLKKNTYHEIKWDQRSPDWDDDHRDDVYQSVRFHVYSSALGRYVSSGWENSREVIIPIRHP